MPRPFGLVVKNGSNARSAVSGDMPSPSSATVMRTWPPDAGDRHGDAAAARHRVAGVEHQVHQDLLELPGVGERVDRLRGGEDLERHVLAERAVEQPLRVERDRVDVDGLELAGGRGG